MYLITIILYTSTFIDPVDRNELFTSGICSWRGALQKTMKSALENIDPLSNVNKLLSLV